MPQTQAKRLDQNREPLTIKVNEQGRIIGVTGLERRAGYGLLRSAAVAVPRRQSTLFNAELEEAIDVIARERVYRMMLGRLRGRLLESLPGPAPHRVVALRPPGPPWRRRSARPKSGWAPGGRRQWGSS